MDEYRSVSALITHRLEVYTGNMLINGTISAPYKRSSDVFNRPEVEFLGIDGATITPLGQPPNQKVIESQVMVGRTQVHFAAEVREAASEGKERITGDLLSRESYVHKSNFPCYAITSTYAIYGHCYLHQHSTLDNLLRALDIFIPITKATIYLTARANISWQRDLILVNKRMLAAMYVLPQGAGGE